MFYKNTFSKKIIFAVFACLFVFTIPVLPVTAGIDDAFNPGTDSGGGGGNGSPLNQSAQEAGYDITQDSPDPIIETIIQVALSFLGVIFLMLTIYGGFLWMTAAGNEEQVGKAKKILTGAIIGLIIVVGAYAISTLVISKLEGATLK